MFAIEMVYMNTKGPDRQRRTSGGDAAAAAAAFVDGHAAVRAASPVPSNRRRVRAAAVN